MKRITSLIIVIAILTTNLMGYRTVYAATSDLSDYEKEILNAYMYTIYHRTSEWIDLYTYEGIEYNFMNCKEERLDFDSEHMDINEDMDVKFLYSSYEKKNDSAKGLKYLAVTGVLFVRNYSSEGSEVINVYQSPPSGVDSWGKAWIPEITLYKVTLGIYIKEIDGKLYACGEKYKYKDISDKDIVTPDELTEDEYITLDSYFDKEFNSIHMEDIYGMENLPLKKWTYADILFIPINKRMSDRRYLPIGYLDGLWNEYNLNSY